MHCAACREGKGTNSPHSNSAPLNRGSKHGEALHFDTFEARSADNKVEYGVAIVEPFSGLIWCPRVKSKDLIAGELIK
jgi:hypothetical protein